MILEAAEVSRARTAVPAGSRADAPPVAALPRSHGIARVDDRRVISGIVYVLRHGLQWRDAPPANGPHKTLYNRFVRWSRVGVFDRIFTALAAEGGPPERLMNDSSHLKAHRTAASLLQKGLFSTALGASAAA